MARFTFLLLIVFSVLFSDLFFGRQAAAGVIEIGTSISLSRNTYSKDSFTWSRRWSGSFAFHFSDVSSIEAAYEDAKQRDKIAGYQDTSYHDRVYTASWVQALMDRNFPIQPFVKAGVGQVNRTTSGSYANGTSPPSKIDSLTAVLGGGLRLFLTQHFVVRAQVTSYLEGGRIRTYKDNVAASLGVSIYF